MYHMSKMFLLSVAHDSVRIAIIGNSEHQAFESVVHWSFKGFPIGLCSPNLFYSRGNRTKGTSVPKAHGLCNARVRGTKSTYAP